MARRYGVRFSFADLVMLGVGATGVWLLWPDAQTSALLIAVTLGHFFLFCNVFRVRRSLELSWAGLFVVNFAAWRMWQSDSEFSWAPVLAVQTPFTLAAIWIEIRTPRYHGIWARRLNPALDAYLHEQPGENQADDRHELDQDV